MIANIIDVSLLAHSLSFQCQEDHRHGLQHPEQAKSTISGIWPSLTPLKLKLQWIQQIHI